MIDELKWSKCHLGGQKKCPKTKVFPEGGKTRQIGLFFAQVPFPPDAGRQGRVTQARNGGRPVCHWRGGAPGCSTAQKARLRGA